MLYLSVFLLIILLWGIMPPQSTGIFSKDATLPLRGLLALFIVFHHISLRLTYMIPQESIVNYLSGFNCWGEPIVSVFFFLSGYGIIKSYQRKGKKYLDGFFSGRMLNIMLPFLICCIFYLPFNNCTLSSLISLETWQNDCPFLPSSWFVVAILVLYFLFYISAKLFSDTVRIVFFAWVLSFVLMACLVRLNFKTFWWHNLIAMNVGMSISLYEEKVSKFLLNKRGIIVVFFSFLLFFWLESNGITTNRWLVLPRVIFLPIFVWQIVSYRKYKSLSFLDWVGRVSYEVYLVHVAILGILFDLVGGHPVLLILLTYALSIISAYLLNYMVRKIS